MLAKTMLCLGAVFLAVLPARAGGREPLDAKKLIDGCYAISEAARATPSITLSDNWTEKTIECLEDEVVKQAGDFEFRMGTEKYREHLHVLRKELDTVVLPIDSENPYCGNSCYPGAITTSLLQWYYAQVLKNLLESMIYRRNSMGF